MRLNACSVCLVSALHSARFVTAREIPIICHVAPASYQDAQWNLGVADRFSCAVYFTCRKSVDENRKWPEMFGLQQDANLVDLLLYIQKHGELKQSKIKGEVSVINCTTTHFQWYPWWMIWISSAWVCKMYFFFFQIKSFKVCLHLNRNTASVVVYRLFKEVAVH